MGAHKLKFKIELVVVNIVSFLFLRYWNKDELDRIFVQLLETLIYAAIALGGRQKLPPVEYSTVQQ